MKAASPSRAGDTVGDLGPSPIATTAQASSSPPGPGRVIGLSHLLLFTLLPLAPFFLSGAVRAAVGLGMGPSLAVATVATAGLAIAGLLWPRPRALELERRATTLALALLALGLVLSAWGLWNPWFGGMVSVGGGDAGVHVQARSVFVNGDWTFYHGFTTFYAFTYWAERLFRLGAFESFRLGFYAVPLAVWLSLAAAAAATARPIDSRAPFRTTATLLVSGATALAILLPLIHYHQADGFFALLFGVAPLMVAWVSYGVAERSATRLAILAIWLVADRFTYGVNVGDSLLTAAALVAWEARRWSGVRRWAAAAGILGLVAGTVVFWLKLGAFVMPVGRIIFSRTAPLLIGELMLAALLLILPGVTAEGRRSPLGRLAGFAAVNGLLNVGGQLLWLVSPLPVGYYFQRYHLHAVVLLAGAAAALGPIALSQGGGRRVTTRLLAVALLSALICLGFAFPRQQESYFERMLGKPPWKRIQPLADLDGLERIERVLAAERKPCLAVLAPSWPMTNFMNGSLGALDRLYAMPFIPLDRHRGCAFWYGEPGDIAAMARYAPRSGWWVEVPLAIGMVSQRLAQELDVASAKACEEYTARWDPRRRIRLCHVCFD